MKFACIIAVADINFKPRIRFTSNVAKIRLKTKLLFKSYLSALSCYKVQVRSRILSTFLVDDSLSKCREFRNNGKIYFSKIFSARSSSFHNRLDNNVAWLFQAVREVIFRFISTTIITNKTKLSFIFDISRDFTYITQYNLLFFYLLGYLNHMRPRFNIFN